MNRRRDLVVERARSAVGRRTVYVLGAGGRHPEAAHPGELVLHDGANVLGCDCSGFAAWVFGIDRFLPNNMIPRYPDGQWFETSAIARDAKEPWGFVHEVPWKAALPGDLLVWGDRTGTDGSRRQGHVGVVVEAAGNGPLQVVHCSLGNFRATGDAIQETDPAVFVRGGAIAARVAWVEA